MKEVQLTPTVRVRVRKRIRYHKKSLALTLALKRPPPLASHQHIGLLLLLRTQAPECLRTHGPRSAPSFGDKFAVNLILQDGCLRLRTEIPVHFLARKVPAVGKQALQERNLRTALPLAEELIDVFSALIEQHFHTVECEQPLGKLHGEFLIPLLPQFATRERPDASGPGIRGRAHQLLGLLECKDRTRQRIVILPVRASAVEPQKSQCSLRRAHDRRLRMFVHIPEDRLRRSGTLHSSRESCSGALTEPVRRLLQTIGIVEFLKRTLRDRTEETGDGVLEEPQFLEGMLQHLYREPAIPRFHLRDEQMLPTHEEWLEPGEHRRKVIECETLLGLITPEGIDRAVHAPHAEGECPRQPLLPLTHPNIQT